MGEYICTRLISPIFHFYKGLGNNPGNDTLGLGPNSDSTH